MSIKKNFLYALFVLFPMKANAGIVASNYGALYVTPPSTLSDVYAGFCDNGNIVVFSTTPTIPIYDMDGREPTSYVYGLPESQIQDFVVAKVTPKGGNRFEIGGQTYSEFSYIGAPP